MIAAAATALLPVLGKLSHLLGTSEPPGESQRCFCSRSEELQFKYQSKAASAWPSSPHRPALAAKLLLGWCTSPRATPKDFSWQWCPAQALHCRERLLAETPGTQSLLKMLSNKLHFFPNITRQFNNNYTKFIINQTSVDIHLAYT